MENSFDALAIADAVKMLHDAKARMAEAQTILKTAATGFARGGDTSALRDLASQLPEDRPPQGVPANANVSFISLRRMFEEAAQLIDDGHIASGFLANINFNR